MQSKIFNTENNYGVITKLFHWVMALLIIGMLIVGNIMGDLKGPDKLQVYGLHKSTGILILFLVFLRLTWRQFNYQPPIPESKRVGAKIFKLMEFAAKSSHVLIYILMFLMPITGWMMSSSVGFPVSFYGLFTMPKVIEPSKETADLFRAAHYYLSWTLIALLCAHISAALFHHFYLKDIVMKRMLPALLFINLALPAFAAVPEFKVDQAKSSVKFEAVQNSAPITGEFKSIDGKIIFAPEDLSSSKISVEVKIDSLTSSYDEMTTSLKGDEWFSVKTFPLAKFESTKIEKNGIGYIASGNLTIRDKTAPASLHFVVKEYDIKHAIADGNFIINRTTFGVGQGDWKDTKSVKDEVKITFHVEAKN